MSWIANAAQAAADEIKRLRKREEVHETTRVEVAGDRLSTSLAMFQHKCSVHIATEQGKPNPDNSLIDTLCEAIRLCRENEQLARSPVKTSSPLTISKVPQ